MRAVTNAEKIDAFVVLLRELRRDICDFSKRLPLKSDLIIQGMQQLDRRFRLMLKQYRGLLHSADGISLCLQVAEAMTAFRIVRSKSFDLMDRETSQAIRENL